MNMTHQESEQPMKFIKLTTIHGNELFVLPHEIRRMFRHLGKGQTQGTQIVMKRRGKDDSVDDVRETPEQILAQIGGDAPESAEAKKHNAEIQQRLLDLSQHLLKAVDGCCFEFIDPDTRAENAREKYLRESVSKLRKFLGKDDPLSEGRSNP